MGIYSGWIYIYIGVDCLVLASGIDGPTPFVNSPGCVGVIYIELVIPKRGDPPSTCKLSLGYISIALNKSERPSLIKETVGRLA